MHTSFLFLKYLALILVGSKIASEIFSRVGLSAVIGEIFIGFLLGVHVLDWIHFLPNSPDAVIVETLSELGLIFMLFYLGLEVNIRQIKEVGLVSVFIALGGVFLPFLAGYFTGLALFPNAGWQAHLFLGAVMTATSVAITARILDDFHLKKSHASRVILASAVLDDILGLIILSVVLALSSSDVAGTTHAPQGLSSLIHLCTGLSEGIFMNLLLISLFLFVICPLFYWTVPPFLKFIKKMEGKGALLVVSIGLMLILSFLAAECHLAPIVGAFFLGVIISSFSSSANRIERDIQPIYLFLSPIFFVFIGIKIDPQVIVSAWKFALILTFVAIVSKFVGTAFIARIFKFSKVKSALIGIGMVPRGEVGLIVANIGLSANIINPTIFSGSAAMCILTILVVPEAIKYLAVRYKKENKNTSVTEEQISASSGQAIS